MRWKLMLFFGLMLSSWAVFAQPASRSPGYTFRKEDRSLTVSSIDVFAQAFPGFDGRPFPGDFEQIDRINQQYTQWPEMNVLGTPVQVGDRKITIQDRLVVPGSAEAMAFTPATGEKQVTGRAITYAGTDWEQVFIPPGSSLVMVQMQVQPEGLPDCADFLLYRFALLSPAYPAVQAWNFSRNDRLAPYPAADTGCPTSGWLYFYVPSLKVDIDRAWITVTELRDTGPVASIWRLSK